MLLRKRLWSNASVLLLAFAACTLSCALAHDHSEIVDLNNDGVRALVKQDYITAIQKFEQALKIDRKYKLALSNLAITYNNFGLQQRKQPTEALKLFHKALLLQPTNATTRQNVDGIIRMMGLDPNSFDDRVELGDRAIRGGDYSGAIIEYSAALVIKNSAEVHEKLGDVYYAIDRKDRALEQFDSSLALHYNLQLDLKLRLLRSLGFVPQILMQPTDRSTQALTLNNPMIALVAFPLLAMLVAFVTRKKRISIWFVGLAIASIFAIAGFFAL